METAAQAPAPAMAGAPPAPAPAAEEPKKDERKFRFKFIPGQKFTLDNLLIHGRVEGELEIGPGFKGTFRTMTADEIQKVEAVPNPRDDTKMLKYWANEMTIAQVYFKLVAMNGIPFQAAPSDPKQEFGKEDLRWKAIRAMASPVFDQLTLAMSEFDRHAQALISPENLKNF